MPEWVSFSKLRGAYSIVGNGVPPFITYPVSYVTAGGEILASDAAPFAEMKPEMTHSVELGIEWKFLQHRLGLNLTYYHTDTLSSFSNCLRLRAISMPIDTSTPEISESGMGDNAGCHSGTDPRLHVEDLSQLLCQ